MRVIPSFIALHLFMAVLILSLTTLFGLHSVPEGYVGIYYRGGALLSSTADPGYHLKLPFTRGKLIQVSLQTDVVREVPCGTAGGVQLYFDKVEVVNKLNRDHVINTVREYGVEYDEIWINARVHHVINEFCSKHTLKEVFIEKFHSLGDNLLRSLQEECDEWNTGIMVESVRVTKPRVPLNVMRKYENMEERKVGVLVALQEKELRKKEEEIARIRAMIRAERDASVVQIAAEKESNVSRIRMERQMILKEGERRIRELGNQMAIVKAQARANSSEYWLKARAKGHAELYTKEYMKYRLISGLGSLKKHYYGENIADVFADINKLVQNEEEKNYE